MWRFTGHLLEVYWTIGNIFQEEVWTHPLLGREFNVHSIQVRIQVDIVGQCCLIVNILCGENRDQSLQQVIAYTSYKRFFHRLVDRWNILPFEIAVLQMSAFLNLKWWNFYWNVNNIIILACIFHVMLLLQVVFVGIFCIIISFK